MEVLSDTIAINDARARPGRGPHDLSGIFGAARENAVRYARRQVRVCAMAGPKSEWTRFLLQWPRRPLKWPVPPPIEMLTPPLGWSQLPKALLMLTVPVW